MSILLPPCMLHNHIVPFAQWVYSQYLLWYSLEMCVDIWLVSSIIIAEDDIS